jgi:serine O-acetyltransferase
VGNNTHVSFRQRIRTLVYLVRSDLWRYQGSASWSAFSHHYRRTPGFRYTCWHRLWNAVEGMPTARFGVQQFISWRLRRLTIRFGLSLPPQTVLGPGFYIGHFGGVVIHPAVRFGRDCNISYGVTLGLASRGELFGCPTVGDRVYIGPGARIFGSIHIGDDAAIGANAVVTKSVPASAVVLGVPGRVVSSKGSAGYIVHTDYGDAPLDPPSPRR